MSEQEEIKNDEVVEEVVETKEEESQQPTETVEEYKQRLENAKAENRRKQEELERLREENNRFRENQPVSEAENIDKQLRRMSDRELEAYLNNNQYANLHIPIKEILDERRFDRYSAKKEESRVRLDAEIELEQRFPDVLNPSHPMALKTKELIRLHRLESHPQGRLIAARLAASELGVKKAVETGRKLEQHRQADVKANFSGEPGRPAPKVSDKVKVEELKKRAQAGDEAARIEWMRYRATTGGL
jgi:hypothetical protein